MKILAFVPCEDVRPELGGKVMLLGVTDAIAFDGSIVTAWPFPVRVAAHLRFQVDSSEPVPSAVTIRIAYGQAEIFTVTAPIVVTRTDLPASVSLGMVIVPVTESGTITFTYSFEKHGEHSWEPFVFGVPVEIQNAAAKVT
jgi:hypothetical protein